MNNQELTHHGVVGMKWGKRKAKNPTSSNSNKTGKEKTKKKIITGKRVALGLLAGIGTASVASVIRKKNAVINSQRLELDNLMMKVKGVGAALETMYGENPFNW